MAVRWSVASAALLATTLAFAPRVGTAADLRFSVSGSAEYDDNVFRTKDGSPQGREDDFIFRIRPRVGLIQRNDDLTYELSYNSPFEKGIKTRQIEDVDHFGSGRFDYRVNDRMRFFGRGGLSYLRNLGNRFRDAGEPTAPPADGELLELNDQRRRILRGQGSLGMTYGFAERLTGQFTVNGSFFQANADNRADNFAVGGAANLIYALAPNHRLGGGARVTRQEFDAVGGQSPSATNVYQVFGSWDWTLDETTTLSVSAGPAFLDTQQDPPPQTVPGQPLTPFFEFDGNTAIFENGVARTPVSGSIGLSDFATCGAVEGTTVLSCRGLVVLDADVPSDAAQIPGVTGPGAPTIDLGFAPGEDPSGSSDTALTLFVNAELQKRWTPTLISVLSYRRSESNASGLGGSTILDAVSAVTSWQPRERWTLELRGDWTRRESVAPLTESFAGVVENDMDFTDNGVTASVAQLSGFLLSREFNTSVDTNRWSVSGRVAHRLTRRLTGTLRLRYNRQGSRNGTQGESSDFDNFLAIVGVQYQFEPIRLW